MSSAGLTVALWALNLDQPLNGPAEWLEQLERRMAEAAAGGAELLALPEYASAVWLNWAPVNRAPRDEVAWMAQQSGKILPALADLVRRHEVALLAGSGPAADGGAYRNRAYLFLPDGRRIEQDKLCLTPAERDPKSWSLESGAALRIIDWQGFRIAVLICLDVELPALAARLAQEHPDLILVPSQTAGHSGFARVTSCARARAVELMCASCVTGCIGPAGVERFTNVGGSAAYVPCEPTLGSAGVLLEQGPCETTSGPGPLAFAPLPLNQIRRLRTNGAEVWPGAWSADHVRIEAT